MSADAPNRSASPRAATGMSRLILWIAQGFGSGRVPAAPGTFGSVAGVGWFLLLIWPGHLWLFFAGTIAGLAASVWLCGKAEKLLGQSDPGSVVLDEIAAVPLCFIAWIVLIETPMPGIPSPGHFIEAWPWMVAVFLLFRVFDIAKPWPANVSQKLPGGWGVTTDDVAAALYVNAAMLLLWSTGLFAPER